MRHSHRPYTCAALSPCWLPANLNHSHCLSCLQVLNKEFEVLTHLARTATSFSRRDAAVALGGFVDKIHELKHK